MIFLLLATAALASPALFQDFQVKYNKNYTSLEEHQKRYAIFLENLEKIEEHNKKGLSWTMGVNQFADMTALEFTAYVKRGSGGGYINIKKPEEERNVKQLPTATCTEIDWTAQNKITPVKNQGQCGSCWSFSTTGAVEGRAAIATGQLKILSEQELVDCDDVDQACNGGLMDNGFEYVIQNNGLCQENDYSYTSGDTKRKGSCKKSGCTHYDAISSYTDVASDNQAQLEAALCEGPVSIAIEADQSSFQMYRGGVLTSSCGSNLDHGVLLVGMGTDGGNDYWKVKNSWGESWGEEGYIRLCRNCNMNCRGIFTQKCSGQCGLMQQPSYPVV